MWLPLARVFPENDWFIGAVLALIIVGLVLWPFFSREIKRSPKEPDHSPPDQE